MTAVMPLWQCLAKAQKSQIGSVELIFTEKAPCGVKVSNSVSLTLWERLTELSVPELIAVLLLELHGELKSD
jgi:hypothetical protein